MDSASAEDLTCPVCQENFKDPFVLTCKHRYCTECLRSFWINTETKKCPLCRRSSSQELPPVMCNLHKETLQLFCVEDQQYVCLTCVNSEKHTNHTFRSIRGAISSYKETKERSSPESEEICGVHDEKLQLFCQEDKQPVCVECVYAETHTNHTFKSISEAASTYKERKERSSPESEEICSLHNLKLTHYCEQDQQPVCLECVTSEKHTDHTIKPISEVASSRKEKLKTTKTTLEENRKHKEKKKEEFKETSKDIKGKVEHTQKQIEHQFEALRQKLEEEKQAAIAALREEEKKMTKTVEEIESQISTLTDAIKDTEEMLKASDDCLLKEADVLMKKVQISQPDPEPPSASSINVSRYLWNLMSNIKKKMEETINSFFQDTPVLLDPKTAHKHLIVSDDQTCVKRREKIPDKTEKPYHPYVLGSEGYNSGKHSWDVEVKDSIFWTVGLTTESNHKKGGDFFKSDNWSVQYDRFGMAKWSVFSVHQHLERVRVELDYDRGTVCFSDPIKNTQLHKFTTTFTETVFPFFHTLDSLKILRLSDE